jgi:hypothetical protein
MRPFLSALCIGSAMLLVNSSWAATVLPGQGSLSVNQGKGFQPVTGQLQAKIGDSVMVSPDGSASIIYADGCKVDLQPGTVATIAPLSPCASGSRADDNFNWGGVAMGVAAGGLLGLGIYEATKSPSSNTTLPASP